MRVRASLIWILFLFAALFFGPLVIWRNAGDDHLLATPNRWTDAPGPIARPHLDR